MDATKKAEIGARLRLKREGAGYTREQLSELCSLSPRFIANIELGTATFSLSSLMVVCRVLSCSSDHLLYGDTVNGDAWSDTVDRLRHLDVKYKESVDKVLQGVIEAIAKAEPLK